MEDLSYWIILVIICYVVFKIQPVKLTSEHFCAFGIIGDCNTVAKNEVTNISNQLSSIDNSIKTSIDENCTSTGKQSNVINIINSTLRNASLNQQNVLKNVCSLQSVLDSNVNADAQNRVLAAIAQNAESKGALIGGSPASSETVTNAISNTSNYINNGQVLDIVKNCVLQIDQQNIANVIGSDLSNTDFNQANDSFMECLASDSNTSNIAATGKNNAELEANQTTKATGGDIFASLASMGTLWIYIAVGVVVLSTVASSVSYGVSSSDAGQDAIRSVSAGLIGKLGKE